MEKDNENLIKEGDEILKNLKQVNADFVNKTKKILTDVSEDIDSTEKDFDKTETKLKEFEKDTSDEIDRIVIESVS